MKKRILLGLSCVLVSLSLFGCGFKKDNIPAVAEVTTNTGEAYACTSSNGLGYTKSGSQKAINRALKLTLQDGDMVSVHFYCDACGHDESLEFTAPEAKMLSCDCPEAGDENGKNAKEYFCILAGKSDLSAVK